MHQRNTPLVSICIPTYNGEKYLRECLDSALSQTFSDFEIIIADDRSKDQTVSIVEEYIKREKRIKLFINEENLGLVGNWNRCIELTNGEWIKFLFQDDVLLPECLERIVKFTDCKERFIIFNRQFIFDENISVDTKKLYTTNILSLQTLLKMNSPDAVGKEKVAQLVAEHVSTNFIGEPTVTMFRKDLVNDIGQFNPMLRQICDLEYWLRIGSNFGVFYIPENLAFFRVHNQSVSAQNRESGMVLIDKVIITHLFSKDDFYATLRSNLSKVTLNKIWEMFKLKICEVNLTLKKNPSNVELLRHYNKVKEVIPIIWQYETPSLKTKLIYFFVKLRRKIRN